MPSDRPGSGGVCGLQLDLMATLHGLRSFEGVKARAAVVEFGVVPLRVASLADVIRSKRARRPQDLAVLPVLEQAHEEATRVAKGEARRRAPRK